MTDSNNSGAEECLPGKIKQNNKHFFCKQVTYDDGEIQLGVEPSRLRKPEEAHRAAMGGALVETGPDWEDLAVRPAMGVRVAVHGCSEAQVSKLVVAMIGGTRLWRLVLR